MKIIEKHSVLREILLRATKPELQKWALAYGNSIVWLNNTEPIKGRREVHAYLVQGWLIFVEVEPEENENRKTQLS